MSRPTPVASFTRLIRTPLTTAPVESETRPIILPPVLCANAEELRAMIARRRQANAMRRDVGEDINRLQSEFRLSNFWLQLQISCVPGKPCYNPVRLVAC